MLHSSTRIFLWLLNVKLFCIINQTYLAPCVPLSGNIFSSLYVDFPWDIWQNRAISYHEQSFNGFFTHQFFSLLYVCVSFRRHHGFSTIHFLTIQFSGWRLVHMGKQRFHFLTGLQKSKNFFLVYLPTWTLNSPDHLHSLLVSV